MLGHCVTSFSCSHGVFSVRNSNGTKFSILSTTIRSPRRPKMPCRVEACDVQSLPASLRIRVMFANRLRLLSHRRSIVTSGAPVRLSSLVKPTLEEIPQRMLALPGSVRLRGLPDWTELSATRAFDGKLRELGLQRRRCSFRTHTEMYTPATWTRWVRRNGG